MIRFARPVASLGVVLAVLTACGGSAATFAPTARPNPTEAPVTTFLPITTPEFTFGPLPSLPGSTASMDSGNDWPATVQTTLSPGRFVNEFANGSFTDSATARECGNDFLYPNGFGFGFPHDLDPHPIEDVTFSAQELVPGTTTTLFHIGVTISEEAGGAHPGTDLDTSDPQFGASGTAQLTVEGGSRHLVVQAADADGVEIHLTATCTSP